MSGESDSYYKEGDYYDKKIINRLRERSKYEMNTMYKKYRFNHKVLRQLVKVNFDLELYNKLKVNGMMCYWKFYRDQKDFIKKQKKRGEVHIILIYPKVFEEIFCELEEESDKDTASIIEK